MMKNLKISNEAHKKLKTYCAEKGLKISEFATLLVEVAIKNIKEGEENTKNKESE